MLSNTVMCGIQGVVLEDHGDVAVFWRDIVHNPVGNADLSF